MSTENTQSLKFGCFCQLYPYSNMTNMCILAPIILSKQAALSIFFKISGSYVTKYGRM